VSGLLTAVTDGDGLALRPEFREDHVPMAIRAQATPKPTTNGRATVRLLLLQSLHLESSAPRCEEAFTFPSVRAVAAHAWYSPAGAHVPLPA